MSRLILVGFESLRALLFATIVFLVSVPSPTRPEEDFPKSSCMGGICVEDGTIDLTTEDVDQIMKILSEDKDRKYKTIKMRSIISGFVYLLSASEPHYYGIEVVLSKEGSKWLVLKKVKSIY